VNDQSLLSPTGVDIVFALLGIVATASALLVVTTRQIVHAALWLVVSLGAVAGCYLVMTAEFVAWMQVLIYLGAVVVLLLFGMMLTRAPIGPSDDLTGTNRVVALFASVAVTAVLAVLVVDAFDSTMIDVDGQESTASVMGEALFRYWVLPFEALSVLLLSALGGAIALSTSDQEA
jgi:NADH-quinone oxidoreductase subunit J